MEEENTQELKTTVGGRNVSSQSDKVTFKEYLQAYCRISYQMLVALLSAFGKSYVDANELSVNTTSSCTVALQESLNDNAYRVYSSIPELLSAFPTYW